jgi:hypothetical protein
MAPPIIPPMIPPTMSPPPAATCEAGVAAIDAIIKVAAIFLENIEFPP